MSNSVDIATHGSSLQEFRLVADLMPHLVWCATPEGNVVHYNKRRGDYGGDSGKSWLSLVHPDERPATLASWSAAQASIDAEPTFEMQHRLQLSDGTYKRHVSRAVAVRNAQRDIVQWYGTATNTQDLVPTLDSAPSEIQGLSSFAKIFSSIIGHDLRNPLSAIKMGGQMLLSAPAVPTIERTQRIAGRIVSSADRMARMIEQLLDFTRLRLGVGLELEAATCDVGEVITQIADEAKATNAGRQIDVVRSGNLCGEWDRERLTRVFSNLVSNAVLHGEGAVPISISVKGETPSEVVVEVKNAGAIPAEAVPDLLKPLRRATSSSKGGLGIGLYIADEIVRLHKGALSFTSSVEEGTCFRVALPR